MRGADVGGALREAWRSSGGWFGLVAATAPTAVFVLVSVLAGLIPAVVAAALAAVAVFTAQRVRAEPLGGAVAGLVVGAVCVAAAAVTGEGRAFFLLPTAFPAVVTLACVGTVLARRPLTGLALNRIAGGPYSWREQPGLLRVYDVTTLVAAVLSAVNFTLRALLYTGDRTAALAVVSAVAGPVAVVFAAATVLAARRRLQREGRTAGPSP